MARLARQVEVAVATVDLTLPQYRVLGILGGGPEASSVLADKLAVSRPSVTGVVDGLVLRGLARRDHDAADRRRIGIELTDDGRRLLAQADTEVERRLDELAAHLDDPGPAFAGLGLWLKALDAHRSARRRARLVPATGEPLEQGRVSAATGAAPRASRERRTSSCRAGSRPATARLAPRSTPTGASRGSAAPGRSCSPTGSRC